MAAHQFAVTETDRPVKIKVEFEVDPRDLVKIMAEIDFEFDREPGIREIRDAVRTTIVQTGISHLLYRANRRTNQANQLAETTDPGARTERSEHLNWCRRLVDRAFKPRKPYRRQQLDQGMSLMDLL